LPHTAHAHKWLLEKEDFTIMSRITEVKRDEVTGEWRKLCTKGASQLILLT
jgi:hypothetical protein